MRNPSISFLTSVGPNSNLEWLKDTALSVETCPFEKEWLVAAPPKIYKAVLEAVEGSRAQVFPFHTGNVGVARNLLLARASRQYVMQLDADDMQAAVGLSILLNAVDEGGFKWGGSPLVDFNKETSPVGTPPKPELLSFPSNVIPRGEISKIRKKMFSFSRMGSVSVHPGACIFDREKFIEVGGYSEEFGNRWEDYVPFFRMSNRYEGLWSPVPTLIYRRSSSSTTASEISETEENFYRDELLRIEEEDVNALRHHSA